MSAVDEAITAIDEQLQELRFLRDLSAACADVWSNHTFRQELVEHMQMNPDATKTAQRLNGRAGLRKPAHEAGIELANQKVLRARDKGSFGDEKVTDREMKLASFITDMAELRQYDEEKKRVAKR